MLEYVTAHDGPPGFSRWDFTGATRANTDHGRLYATAAGLLNVTLYRDAARTAAVAQGSLAGNTGEMSLSAVNDSGLSGTARLEQAGTGLFTLDVFYACDADLSGRQTGLEQFLAAGQFAGRSGFSGPCLRAKRVLDALLDRCLPPGWQADSLQPLAEPAALLALQFVHETLAARQDEPAAACARAFALQARLTLQSLRLGVAGRIHTPFEPRVTRA